MSTELVASLRPVDLQREAPLGNSPAVTLVDSSGDVRGVSLPKYVTSAQRSYGYTALVRIPANLTMGTGLTFKFYLTDDGSNANDPGKKCYIGVTVKRMAADETFDVDTGAGTEQLVSVTLSSTAGGVAIGSLAIANANLDSAAVGDLVLIRIRRKGTDTTNDTCQGRVILMGAEIQNT
jgi:hypothetical protein